MNIPDRLQASRQHKEPEGTKRVCRPSKYGNKYKLITGGFLSVAMQHEHAVNMYKIQMEENLSNDPAYYDDLFNYEHISCFCPPHLPCHTDAIIAHLKRRAAELEQVAA